jgi:hypothetical protein
VGEPLIVEAWSQGFMVGGIVVLIMLVVANMKRKMLHVLILVEVILLLGHGTFIFVPDPTYSW